MSGSSNIFAIRYYVLWNILLFRTIFATALYFPMYDIEMQFSQEFLHTSLQTNNRYPLINIISVPSEKHLLLIIDKENAFLKIDPQKGYLTFKDSKSKFAYLQKNWPDIINATVIATMSDVETHLNTTFRIYNFKPKQKDASLLKCSDFVSDICFWYSVKYQLMENSEPTVLGTITSPFFTHLCHNQEINYTISRGGESFALDYSDSIIRLKSAKPLDRDNNGSIVDIEISCSVNNLDDKGSKVNVSKTISINILDVNDNLPRAQEQHIDVHLLRDFVQEGEEVQVKNLIFKDADSPLANRNYTFHILNDTLNLLRLSCNFYEYDVEKQSQTVTHCKLYFTKNFKFLKETYTIIVQINDTTLVDKNNHKNTTVSTIVRFILPHGNSILYDKRNATGSIYPKQSIAYKILRFAAPYARVAEPKPLNNARNVRNQFKILSDSIASSQKPSGVFNVTDTEGIVYIQNSSLLKNSSSNISVTIQCDLIRFNGGGKRQLQDTIFISLLDDSKDTCSENEHKNIWNYPHCAGKKTAKSCMLTCGIGTGGTYSTANFVQGRSKYCIWRGDKNPGNQHTTEYATCTPNTDHCPNGICDSLEDLHHLICPQDCSRDVHFPTVINPKTGRGISGSKGICVCDNAEKCSCHTIASTVLKKQANTSVVHRSQHPPIISHHNYPIVAEDQLNACEFECISAILGGILLLASLCSVVLFWYCTNNKRRSRFKDSPGEQPMIIHETQYNNAILPTEVTSLFAAPVTIIDPDIVDSKWEFPRHKLFIEQTLGEGEFGKVLRARALDVAGKIGYTTVAVKTLKDGANTDELTDLLSEYELLKQVSHPNVVRLLGASTLPGGPVYLIIEFAENGCLRNYLRNSRCETMAVTISNRFEVTPKDILNFAWQISKGMAYLCDMKLVHRDLATRNVLVTENKICKVSDFGLTRDVYQDDAYLKKSKGRVPVKWMAPESLADHIYTSKSDVWSFGIVIWELVTLGASPYPGVAAQDLYYLIRSGYRMEKPDNCSEVIYRIMQQCWQEDPNGRPSFRSLALQWEQLLSDGIEYLDLSSRIVQNRTYFDNLSSSISPIVTPLQSTDVNYLSKIKSEDEDKCCQNGNKLSSILNNIPQELCHYESPIKHSNEPYIDMKTRNQYENTSI